MLNKTLTYIFALTVITTLAWQANTAKAQKFGAQDGLVSHWTFDKADIDGTTVRGAMAEYNNGSRDLSDVWF